MTWEDTLQELVNWLEPMHWFFILYFVLVNLTYIILVLISFFYIRSQANYTKVFNLSGLFQSDLYAPVSIIAPAYNEELNIVSSVEALLQLQYPDYEVIVVNDGSTDQTLLKLIEHFELYSIPVPKTQQLDHKPIKAVFRSERYSNLVVVDKVNGKKADALNAGINLATMPLVCSIDADSILDPDVLKKLLKAFIEDEEVVAAGGIVRIANGCTIKDSIIKEVGLPASFLGRIQSVEYLRSFLFGRIGWDYLDSLLIISGAFGVFDRKTVIKVGGYLHDTVGEDMELVVRIHRYFRELGRPYKVRFLPEPVCWTEVPEDWSVLGRQRNRWQRGLADTLWRHKKMLFNPRYGRLGFLAMPYFLFVELLGPVFELIGFVYFLIVILIGSINPVFAALFLVSAVLLGIILSVSAVVCEEFTYRRYPRAKEVLVLTVFAFLENLGYRQIHTWWRFNGLFKFLKGDKEWGLMIRKGLESTEPNQDERKHKGQAWTKFKQKIRPFGYWLVIYLLPVIIVFILIKVLVLDTSVFELF